MQTPILRNPNGPGRPAHTEKYGVMSPFHTGGGGGGGGGSGAFATQAPLCVSSSNPGGQYGTHMPFDGTWPTGHAAARMAGMATVTIAMGAAVIAATKSIAVAARRRKTHRSTPSCVNHRLTNTPRQPRVDV